MDPSRTEIKNNEIDKKLKLNAMGDAPNLQQTQSSVLDNKQHGKFQTAEKNREDNCDVRFLVRLLQVRKNENGV